LLWVAIGAVGFSLVDWRQTKHLAHLLPPLVALTGAFWASRPKAARDVLTVVITVGVIWNVWRIGRLMLDFGYLAPKPIW
jgi:hypothetical protein